MKGRSLGATGVAMVVVLVLCGGLAGALLTGGGPAAAGCYTTTGTRGAPPLPAVTVTPPPEGFRRVDRWDAEQVANAAVILSVGAGKGGTAARLGGRPRDRHAGVVPGQPARRGPGLDRAVPATPLPGLGNPTQLRDPRYATTAFYDRLLTIDGWQAMPLTDAAQAAQRSAYPGAYAKWENDAIVLIHALVVAWLSGAGEVRNPLSAAGQRMLSVGVLTWAEDS